MRSMTGFGRARYEANERVYEIEIKSVNHKYSDISIKMPRIFNFLEDKIRKTISEKIYRGKIDVYISFKNNGEKGRKICFNDELAKAYIDGLKAIAEKNEIQANIEVIDISKMPDVLEIETEYEEEMLEEEILNCLNQAIEQFITMKEKEGTKLEEDLEKRLEKIEEKIGEISQFSTGLVDEYVVKLKERIKEMLDVAVVDENRIAQEIVIYSDKCSIQEELTRLKSHIEQAKQFIKMPSPIGKKIDFLIQEMNRESNTIGSKANCLEITKRVVDIKTEIENIREQIQNIE